MRLTVLGGSAAGGNTGAGCSGYLIENGETRLVVDLGPGTLLELRRHIDFRSLSGVVISHLHLDHVLDIAALRFALAYNPVPPVRRVPLWLPPGGVEWIHRIAHAFSDEGDEREFVESVFDVAEYEPRLGVNVDGVDITFLPTVHYIPCWAMRLSAAGHGQIGYTADTGPAAPLGPFFAGVDVLVAEATLAEPDEVAFDQRGHLTAREAGVVAREAAATTLVLSHMWEEIGFERQRAAASSVFAGRIEVAYPGLVVESSLVRMA